MTSKYSDYFDLDPDFFPCISKDIIQKHPNIWLEFYPHETFIKLLSDTIRILRREERGSLWVEGAYGTGKSHAVLTLKKLLDSTAQETKEYFNKYQHLEKELSNDLLTKLLGLKENDKILTVHRIGSSSIDRDADLINAMQESIAMSLKEQGFDITPTPTLVDKFLNWVKDDANREYLNRIIQEKYSNKFGGDNLDDIIYSLNNLHGNELVSLMSKIEEIGSEQGLLFTKLDIEGLKSWIKEIINEYKLNSIIFIWDEFTEFFRRNRKQLTGFQQICELCQTDNFYLIIVTHERQSLIAENDGDFKKILDRFHSPSCKIELPNNIALKLMASAMKKTTDKTKFEEWNDVSEELWQDLKESSNHIIHQVHKLDLDLLRNVLPIQPYTALVLQTISSVFESNQRSMFDFIKNDTDSQEGFQWYIRNYGIDDEDKRLLTVDMLWNYFYDIGKDKLPDNIKNLLSTYESNKGLLEQVEQRVYKAVLLLGAISEKVTTNVPIFIPNEENINKLFEGTLPIGQPKKIVESLVNSRKILYKKDLGKDKYQYSAHTQVIDDTQITSIKDDKLQKTKTSTLVPKDSKYAQDILGLEGALNLRYDLLCLTKDNFEAEVNKLINNANYNPYKFTAVLTFAKNDNEANTITQRIEQRMQDTNLPDNIVFIDTSYSPLGEKIFEDYVDKLAHALYYQSKDKGQAQSYEKQAKNYIEDWILQIKQGTFLIYSKLLNPSCLKASNIDKVLETLQTINNAKYPGYLDNRFKLGDQFYQNTNLKLGAECGYSRTLKSRFNNPSLDDMFKDFLNYHGDKAYWQTYPHDRISKLKIALDSFMAEKFTKAGQVSMVDIYSFVKSKPYGLMPCNFTAFILGFLLKEYVDSSYNWADQRTNDILDLTKLKDMIDTVIKNDIVGKPSKEEDYIQAITDIDRTFNELTATAFNGSKQGNYISQINTIKNKSNDLPFPIWSIGELLTENPPSGLTSDISALKEAIENYHILPNYQEGDKDTDNTQHLKQKLVDLNKDNPNLGQDLRNLLTDDNCIAGIKTYVENYKDGKLAKLAYDVSGNDSYIKELKNRFSHTEGKWLWRKEEIDTFIDQLIIEYNTVILSKGLIVESHSYEEMLSNWKRKCEDIHLTFEGIKSSVKKDYGENIVELLDLLKEIYTSGNLRQESRKKFHDLLDSCKNDYQEFMNNCLDIFKRTFENILIDLESEDIKKIYDDMPPNSFILLAKTYYENLNTKVKEYKSNSIYNKLKSTWKAKTNTISPEEWSSLHNLPIIIMVPEDEQSEANFAFDEINHNSHVDEKLNKAWNYLSGLSDEFYQSLSDKEAQDKAFKKYMLRNYSVLFDDITEVKNVLKDICRGISPYNWYKNTRVEKCIIDSAERKYKYEAGYAPALSKIDEMDALKVKEYLKDLIKDNVTIGIEIINDK